MNNSVLTAVEASAPDWITDPTWSGDQLLLTARPRRPSGRPGRVYRLRIEGDPLKVWEVPEHEGLRLLPTICPERHVNSDGSFCLGLMPLSAQADQLDAFWAILRAYLLCQDFAATQGRWPNGRWLSHGNAAYRQIEAEAAAAEAGLSERYRRALEFGEGWLAGDLTPRSSVRLPRVRPATARRQALEALVDAERRRRAAEAAFADSLFCWGDRCCRTMHVCPLRNLEDARSPTPPPTPTLTPTLSAPEKPHAHD